MDKLMRDKLSSIEFPYDPQQWEQMEKMLEDKKDRKGLFWWWATGAAAVLLISAGVYLQMNTGMEKPTVLHNTEQGVARSTAPVIVPGQDKPGISSNSSNKGTQPAFTKADAPANSAKTGSTIQPTFKGKEKGGTQAKYSNGNGRLAKRQKREPEVYGKYKEPGSESILVSEKELNTPTALAEELYIETKALQQLTINAELAEPGKVNGEEDLPKKKRQRVRLYYSIGVIANITGTVVGPNRKAEPITSAPAPPAINNTLHSKPSYMLGFTHDLMLGKRLAFTNSVLFSRTSFKVNSVRAVNFSTAPQEYTSAITELDVAIGLKAYPIVKPHICMYIGAGVINHIKRKETFEYKLSTVSAGADLLPAETKFNASDVAYGPGGNIVGGKKPGTSDFSINRANRYYTSFYGSIGTEFIIGNHYVLFAEPVMYMSLQKIGVQDMHKFNVGLGGGFRYRF